MNGSRQALRHLVDPAESPEAVWQAARAGVEIYQFERTTVCFHERGLVEQLQAIFLADLARCRKVALSDWLRRSFRQQAREVFASLIEDQV
jgi:hypothetical protein